MAQKKIEPIPFSKSGIKWAKWALKNIPAIGVKGATAMWNTYKKLRTKKRTAKTKAETKKYDQKIKKLEMDVRKAQSKSKVEGFARTTKTAEQKAREAARIAKEKLRQERIKTKQSSYDLKSKKIADKKIKKVDNKKVTADNKTVTTTAEKVKNIAGKPPRVNRSLIRSGIIRGTGYGRRSGDVTRRPVRKYITTPGLVGGYATHKESDPLISKIPVVGKDIVDWKNRMKNQKAGGKVYKIDNQGQDFVKKMYGGKVKK